MTVCFRKIVVVGVIVVVILLANTWVIAAWLDDVGVVAWARNLKTEYLTGTALTIIVVMFVLLPSQVVWTRFARRCPVCDCPLLRRGRYCVECGSKV